RQGCTSGTPARRRGGGRRSRIPGSPWSSPSSPLHAQGGSRGGPVLGGRVVVLVLVLGDAARGRVQHRCEVVLPVHVEVIEGLLDGGGADRDQPLDADAPALREGEPEEPA